MKLTDALLPHFPFPAALAASSSSIRWLISGAALIPSLLTVTNPSETSDSVMFSADAGSKQRFYIIFPNILKIYITFS